MLSGLEFPADLFHIVVVLGREVPELIIRIKFPDRVVTLQAPAITVAEGLDAAEKAGYQVRHDAWHLHEAPPSKGGEKTLTVYAEPATA